MHAGDFTFHRLASTMYDQFPVTDQADLIERLESLKGLAPADWPKSIARKISHDPPMYLLSVNDSMRAFLTFEDGQRVVRDLVRQEALDSFAASMNSTSR